MINVKYLDPFLKELQEKEQELTTTSNPTKLLQKKVHYNVLEKKYGKDGFKLVAGWERVFDELAEIKNKLDKSKNRIEKKIANESRQNELNIKFNEIKQARDLLLAVRAHAGEDEELTTAEFDKYTKEEKPDETSEELNAKIGRLEEDYLTLAKELGTTSKLIQNEIKLRTLELDRFKAFKMGITRKIT